MTNIQATEKPRRAKKPKAEDAKPAEKKAKTATKTQAKPTARKTTARKTAAKAVSPAVNDEQRLAMVREAAYFRAEQRGFVGGDPVQDWIEAELEVNAQLGA